LIRRYTTMASSQVARLSAENAQPIYRSESLMNRAMRRLRRDYLTLIALVVLSVLVVLSALAPFITTTILQVDPESTNPSVRLLPPGSPGHILGTDDLGRDYAARLLYGGQISLAI